MKTRSALLLAFMIVVPAVAMFSHRIPSDVRRTIRTQIGRWASAVATSKAGPSPSVVSESARLSPAAEPDPVPSHVGETSVAAAGAASVAPPDVPLGDDVAGRLLRLGAIGFECRPVAGGDGTHVASCSVPLDDSGQLVRVFSVTGGDAGSAAASLLDDVAAWRDRSAVRRAAAQPERPNAVPLRF